MQSYHFFKMLLGIKMKHTNHEYQNQINSFFRIFRPIVMNLRQLVIMVVIALIIGASSGGVGILLYHALARVTTFRTDHPLILFLLPAGGLLIVFLYKITDQFDNTGTNLILSAVQSNTFIPFRVAPLMFAATVITHLFGGSVGREGAALQIGGSIGETIAQRLNMDQDDQHIVIMCAMSACFSAVFGTPIAAAIFSMEVISIGMMHYAALIPCVIASETAALLARRFGALPEAFPVIDVPAFSFANGGKIILAGIALAGISVVFCIVLHLSEHLFKKYFHNPYIRIVVGGGMIILLTLVLRSRDYLGTSMPMIERCFELGSIPFYAFAVKMIFTAITLGAGYKGGEIVPSFVIGGTLGCLLGHILGFPPQLTTACGMVGVFCGVTNCPITSLLIAFELFGFTGAPYYLVTIAVCYMMSGYYGLYSSQSIVYSKHHEKLINRRVNK